MIVLVKTSYHVGDNDGGDDDGDVCDIKNDYVYPDDDNDEEDDENDDTDPDDVYDSDGDNDNDSNDDDDSTCHNNII